MVETNLAKLEAALHEDPHDEAARAVYADALLESGETTRGELIAWTAKLEAGDDSAELALRVRQLEKVIERELNQALAKAGRKTTKFVLCKFRHGLVDRIELGGRWALDTGEQHHALAKFLMRPELLFLHGVDLRRTWPQQEKQQRNLTDALPKIFRTPSTIEWLGVGPRAVSNGKDLDALATNFPKLEGLALTCHEGGGVLDALAAKDRGLSRRLIDLEIAGEDVGDEEVEKMLALSPSLPNLKRYVMFWETADDDIKRLDSILGGRTFPKLTSLGVMLTDVEGNARLLDRILRSKIFKRLTSIGLASDFLGDEVEEWLMSHAEAIAHIAFYGAPGFVTTEDPGWDEARDGLAMALYTIDRDEEALRLREDLIIADPKEAHYWDKLGDSLREVERHEEALAAFERAIALDKDLDTAWSGKADSLSDLNREAEALVAWNRALKIDPRDAYTQNGRAVTLANLGRHAEALKGYNAAIKIDDAFTPPYSNRADVFVSLQRFADALKGYQHVLDAKDDDANALRSYVLNRMGLIHLVNGDRARASKHFDQAIALADKEDEETAMHARINLARMHVKAGRHREALEIFELLCRQSRVNWDDNHGRAWTLLEMGSAKEALAIFENECGLQGSAVERLFALEALGKKKEALVELDGFAKRPMTGCLYRWVSASLLHALLLNGGLLDSGRDGGLLDGGLLDGGLLDGGLLDGGLLDGGLLDGGRRDGGRGADDEAKKALARARATPLEPTKHFEALRKRAVKERGKPECTLVSCITSAALIAILASLLEGEQDEAEARAAALVDHLSSTDPMNELGLRWEVTRAARMAKLDERYPFVPPLIAACEVMLLPSKVKLPGKRARKTKKSR